MTRKAGIAAVLCVPLAVVAFGLALGALAPFTPPPSPEASAAEIARLYAGHRSGVIVGCALFLASGTLLAPITALYSVFIREMESHRPFLTYTQLVTGTVALVLFIPPTLFWGVAAFRPGRSAELVLMLDDLGWLSFIWTIWPGILQVTTLGVAMLQDRHAEPLFPRWLAYFNLAGVPVLLLGSLAPLAMSGPFAWNGLLTHYVPVAYFLSWWLVMAAFSFRALRSPRLFNGL